MAKKKGNKKTSKASAKSKKDVVEPGKVSPTEETKKPAKADTSVVKEAKKILKKQIAEETLPENTDKWLKKHFENVEKGGRGSKTSEKILKDWVSKQKEE